MPRLWLNATPRHGPRGGQPFTQRKSYCPAAHDQPKNGNVSMNRTRFTIAIFSALSLIGFRAHAETWQPSPGHAQLPIWPGVAPDAQPAAGPEDIDIDKDEWI